MSVGQFFKLTRYEAGPEDINRKDNGKNKVSNFISILGERLNRGQNLRARARFGRGQHATLAADPEMTGLAVLWTSSLDKYSIIFPF